MFGHKRKSGREITAEIPTGAGSAIFGAFFS
jgi:hypothetical protein